MSERPAADQSAFELRGEQLTLKELNQIARGRLRLRLTDDSSVLERMRASCEIVREAVDSGRQIYGVTTGFGRMASVSVEADHAEKSQANLLAFLSTGAGDPIDARHVRAAMALRANVLLRGASAVRHEIVNRYVQFLNADLIPVVRELGSIGASGDLVPLATIARAILGHPTPSRLERNGHPMDGRVALSELGLSPLELAPKEALAMVNGTSFSSAIAANCVNASRTGLALSLATHAMMLRALLGHHEPFAEFVHACKPHPGQVFAARIMRQLLGVDLAAGHSGNGAARPHLQDAYSLRCSPQYLGSLIEGIVRTGRTVVIEMNGVTDNPLVDVDERQILQSGNFLGQYVGIAMDDLRRCLGLLAKHLDVQIAQLVSPEFNHGLPASLAGNSQLPFNMGLKGLQITGNSIVPMLTHLGNPLVEHFPTHAEQFNQNVNGLSWGAAHLAWRSVRLFQQYLASALIFAVQALDLRAYKQCGSFDGRRLIGDELEPLYAAVHATVDCVPSGESPFVFDDADQSLEQYLERISLSIDNERAIVASVQPIVDAIDEFDVGC